MMLRVVDAWYTREDDGYRQTMPVLSVVGRDESWERHHVRIDQYRPYFCATEAEWDRLGGELREDDRVLDWTREDRRGRPEVGIHGDDLVRVVCRDPGDVGDLRELFENPHEADVLYPTRFLVDHDVTQWIDVPDSVCEDADEVASVDEVSIGVDEEPAVTPPLRTVTYDIEVAQSSSGPPVVSKEGTEQARNPITAISAHDSYTDEYRVWVLLHDEWDANDSEVARESVDADVSVYANPKDIASQFCEWVTERDMDAMIGWAANGFDHPYLVNWCLKNNVRSVYDLSPTGDVYEMSGDGKFINSSLKGRLLLDLMDMYSKTRVHELDSKRLEDVAEVEGVSVGKLSIEDEIDVPRGEPAIGYARQHHPDVFTEYSVKDVKAAVAINRESQTDVNIL